MKIRSKTLLAELENATRQLVNQANELKDYPLTALTFKESPEKWNILECFAHLNLYGNFYLPEITQRIQESRFGKDEIFNSGWLGNYFAKSMLPKEKLNKMKTFKNMNPLNSDLNKGEIGVFLNQQAGILKLLEEAAEVSLNNTKTGISISSLIKLKLGDTFRVVIFHNQRHFEQIAKLLEIWSEKHRPNRQEVEVDLRNF